MTKFINPNVHQVEINLGNPSRRNVTVAPVHARPAPGVVRVLEMSEAKAAQFVQIGMLAHAPESIKTADLDCIAIDEAASVINAGRFPGRGNTSEAAIAADKARRANAEREFRIKEASELGQLKVVEELERSAGVQRERQEDADRGVIESNTAAVPVPAAPAAPAAAPATATETEPKPEGTAPEAQQPVAPESSVIAELRARAAAVAENGAGSLNGPTPEEVAAAEKEALEAATQAAADMARMGLGVVDQNTKIEPTE